MDTEERFAAGDRNSANGTLKGQQEAQEGVFEDGQVRDTTGEIRQLKDSESYVYGDSRPDETEPSDTFEAIDDNPMMTTTREEFPEAKKADPEFLEANRVDRQDHVEAHYRKSDGGEEAVLVEGAHEGGNEEL